MKAGTIIEELENEVCEGKDISCNIGDTIVVYFNITEGDKRVAQKFKGIVSADKGRAVNRSITVRHITGGIGVERVFPLYSPNIEQIEVLKMGDVRRAKLYYLRDLGGKAATKVKEKRFVPQKKKEKK